MSCSRTKHSDAGEARTRGPFVSSQALYHLATALPRSILLQRKMLEILENCITDTLTNILDPDMLLQNAASCDRGPTFFFAKSNPHRHLQCDLINKNL